MPKSSGSAILEKRIETGLSDLDKRFSKKLPDNFWTRAYDIFSIVMVIKDITEYAHTNGYHRHPEYCGKLITTLITYDKP